MPKNILIAAGGTGGHLFPAMAVGDELINSSNGDIKLHFIGTENRIESKKVPQAGYPYFPMPIKAFPGKSLKTFGWFFNFRRSIDLAKKVIKDNKIQALVCAGAYLSIPPGLAAGKLGIPIFLMESNVNLGKAHRILLKRAEKIFISWKETYSELSQFQTKAVLTGNPVRESIFSNISKEEAKQKLGFDTKKKLILIIGGSLGAKSINEAIEESLPKIKQMNASLLWQMGGSFEDETENEITQDDIKKVKFIDDMGTAYKAADIVVSRSGATAVSEICNLGASSILIPLSSASNNEQYLNAKNLSSNNAAKVVLDSELKNKLFNQIKELNDSDKLRSSLSENSKSLAKPDAAKKIAESILESI